MLTCIAIFLLKIACFYLAHMTPRSRSQSVNDKSGGGVCGIFSRKPQQPLIEQVRSDKLNSFISNKERSYTCFKTAVNNLHDKFSGDLY